MVWGGTHLVKGLGREGGRRERKRERERDHHRAKILNLALYDSRSYILGKIYCNYNLHYLS